MSPSIHIIKASYVGAYDVDLTFSDGKIQRVNFGNFLRRNPHPQYDKYKNGEAFKSFRIEQGNIVWGKDWDLIFPIAELYKGKVS
jgi:hypothetical protein